MQDEGRVDNLALEVVDANDEGGIQGHGDSSCFTIWDCPGRNCRDDVRSYLYVLKIS